MWFLSQTIFKQLYSEFYFHLYSYHFIPSLLLYRTFLKIIVCGSSFHCIKSFRWEVCVMWPKQDFPFRRRDRSLSAESVSLLGCIAFSDRDRDREGGRGTGGREGCATGIASFLTLWRMVLKPKHRIYKLFQNFKSKKKQSTRPSQTKIKAPVGLCWAHIAARAEVPGWVNFNKEVRPTPNRSGGFWGTGQIHSLLSSVLKFWAPWDVCWL